ncbi:uncharacterized protein LOC135685948 [Rhopilema esculentum]|uniref:uncharacterized protein LOC135685948 n=1 Tax=Rhopilema esculentum TaxID=499914 RepID=UPI0031D48EBC|eukprot:gene474-10151_t
MVMLIANHRKKWLVLLVIFALATVYADLDLSRYERDLSAANEHGSDQDVDIFIAEILPEGAQNLEQMFRPLARYKKAVIDAQIEPVEEAQNTKNSDSEFLVPSAHNRNTLTAYSSLESTTQTPTSSTFYRIKPLTMYEEQTKSSSSVIHSEQPTFSTDKTERGEGIMNASDDAEPSNDQWSKDGSGSGTAGDEDSSGDKTVDTIAPLTTTSGASKAVQNNGNISSNSFNDSKNMAYSHNVIDFSEAYNNSANSAPIYNMKINLEYRPADEDRHEPAKNVTVQAIGKNDPLDQETDQTTDYKGNTYTSTANPHIYNARFNYTHLYQTVQRQEPKAGKDTKIGEQVSTTEQLSTSMHINSTEHVGTSEHMSTNEQSVNSSLNAAVKQGAGIYTEIGSGGDDPANEAEEDSEISGEKEANDENKPERQHKSIQLGTNSSNSNMENDEAVSSVFGKMSLDKNNKIHRLNILKPNANSFEEDQKKDNYANEYTSDGLRAIKRPENTTRSIVGINSLQTPNVQQENFPVNHDVDDQKESDNKDQTQLDQTFKSNPRADTVLHSSVDNLSNASNVDLQLKKSNSTVYKTTDVNSNFGDLQHNNREMSSGAVTDHTGFASSFQGMSKDLPKENITSVSTTSFKSGLDNKSGLYTGLESEMKQNEKPISNSSIESKNSQGVKLTKEEAARKIFMSSYEVKEELENAEAENPGSGEREEAEETTNDKNVAGKSKNSFLMTTVEDDINNLKDNSLVDGQHESANTEARKHFEKVSDATLKDKGSLHSDSRKSPLTKKFSPDKNGLLAQNQEVNKILPHTRQGKSLRSGKSRHNAEKSDSERKRSNSRIKVQKTKKRKKSGRNFIIAMMSEKARELYKTLIHDTSKALMARKRHEERRRHHMRYTKPGIYAEKKQKGKFQVIRPDNRANVKGPIGLKNLATNILSTMVANDHKLLQQAATKTVEVGEIKDFTQSKQNSLVEKLAELKLSTKKSKEIPLPLRENEEDTSLDSDAMENENPGKTVLQKQTKVGLGNNVNLDNLDGVKQDYEYKTIDQEIEGELATNEKIEKESIGAMIGKLSPNEENASSELIMQSMATGNSAAALLSSYNSEESLENKTEQYQSQTNGVTNMTATPLKQEGGKQNITEIQAKNTSSTRVPENAGTWRSEKERMAKAMARLRGQLRRHPSLYFAGNSSLWKNHPVVSMNIDDLVHVFYEVNHKNLIDLVEHPTAQPKGNDIAQNRKMGKNNITEKEAKHRKLRKKFQKEVQEKPRTKRKKRKHMRKKSKGRKKRKHHRAKTFLPLSSEGSNDRWKDKHRKNRKKSRSHVKKTNRLHKHRYKAKNHRHVNGIAKFGISGTLKIQSPAEEPTFKNHMPNNVKYFKIERAAKQGAVCIDGSIPGYYFRQGNGKDHNKWIIHLHGGAWCYDPETCYRRSKSILGSTKHWSAENITNFFQGILSDKNEINPWFKNWNVVVQSYCDGGFFSGKRVEPLIYRGAKMYFRGRQILKAMIKSLKGRGLEKASDVILSGTSAGGLAVLLQGDYLKHKLPKTATVRGLVDAGFFLDSQAEGSVDVTENQFKGLYETHMPKLRTKCEKGRDNSTKFKCLLPQNMVQYTSLPLYFVNSLYDHWQLSELHQLRCIYNNEKCQPQQRDRILEFRNDMYKNLKEALKDSKHHGLFADSCIGHGQAIVDYTWSRIRVNNQTLNDAFNEWVNDKHGEKRHWNVDCHFPCNGSCPKPLVKSCIKNFEGASQNHRTKRFTELC